VPTEVAEYRKRQSDEKLTALRADSEKGTVSFSSAPEGVFMVREGQKVGQAATSSALDLIKKKLQDSGGSDNVDGNSNRLADIEAKEKTKDTNTEKSSSESSSDSEEEEQGPSKDERVAQFKVKSSYIDDDLCQHSNDLLIDNF
jgi:transcription elongation regulator 1